MTITFSPPELDEQLKPRITVIGVGGAGGNAVNNMISKQLDGVEFIVANTDAQALAQSLAERRVQLGRAITHGLGAGSRPDMGRAAAEEAIDDLAQYLNGSHMVFIAAGMGGGTGTGAGPVIARMAREQGMLTVGVVTKPFQFEGTNRMRIADAGIEEMQQFVDTLIVIPNQNLFRVANEKTTFADAFAMADDVLHCGVRGVTDLMVVPGLINLDFADIRSVMSEMGKAMMGTGEADGDERARLAAEAAISNPLLDDVSMKGARGVLINITGGPDMTLFEVDEAANRIGEEVDPEANIIFGSALDPTLDGRIRVSVVATGIDIEAGAQPRPVLRVFNEHMPPRQAVGEQNSLRPVAAPAGLPRTPVAMGGGAPATAMAKPAMTEEEAPRGSVQTDLAKPVPPAPPSPVATAEPRAAKAADAPLPAQQRPEADRGAVDPAHAVVRETAPIAAEAEPFIPPPPTEPPRKEIPSTDAVANPYRGAETLDGARAEKREPNLFQRMTRPTWGRRTTGTEETPVRPATPQPSAPPKASVPETPPRATERPKPPPAPPTPTPASAEPASSQPRLRGVDADDRLPNSQNEEDLLDIPAFLRRQAN